MNDQAPTPVNPIYVSDFNRILRSMLARLPLTEGRANANEIANQIAIRCFTLSISSARREVTSARAVCRAFIADGFWPEGVIEIPAVSRMSLDEVGRVLDFVSLPMGELIPIGQELVEELTTRMMRAGHPGSSEDLAQAFSGFSPTRSRETSPARDTHVPITEGDLSCIDFHMMDHPCEEAIRTFDAPRRNVIALTRIFLRVIWLTGMRPVEVFGCRLMSGDPDRDYTYDQLELIRRHPEKAALSGLLTPQEALSGLLTPQEALPGAEEIGHSRTVLTAVKATGITPVLLVKNAKTRNANPDLVRPYRVQVLAGISDEDLHMISLAALLQRTPIESAQKKCLVNLVTRRIRTISAEEFPDRVNPINLYALRHDFATRARRALPAFAVAALMGHTSYRTTRGYGKAQTRRTGSRSGSGSGGWTPGCDETVADRLRSAFGYSRPEQGPEPDPAPTNA